MKTIEVQEKHWDQFCQQLEEFCRGAMVTINVDHGGKKTTLAERLPLRHLELDTKADPCNTNLVIEAGVQEGKRVRHTVVEPIHIRLKNGNENDQYNHLQILAEGGTTTVELHPGLNQALLQGLAV